MGHPLVFPAQRFFSARRDAVVWYPTTAPKLFHHKFRYFYLLKNTHDRRHTYARRSTPTRIMNGVSRSFGAWRRKHYTIRVLDFRLIKEGSFRPRTPSPIKHQFQKIKNSLIKTWNLRVWGYSVSSAKIWAPGAKVPRRAGKILGTGDTIW